MGALEADVLDTLWRMDEPMTPGEVREQLGGDLAYTTIMTVLSRLHQKDLVDRARTGRAYAYTPRMSEADHVATKMRSALATTSDHHETLSRFVGSLTSEEAAALRAVLDATGP